MIPDNILTTTVAAGYRKCGINLPGAAIILPLVGITISEVFLFFGLTRKALWGHLITLLVCTFVPLHFDDDPTMFPAFALVPLFRLVNLGMPIFFELTIYWFPIIYWSLIPAIYFVASADNSIKISPGWRPAILALPLVIPVSAFLATIEFRILDPEALIPAWNAAQLLLIGVVMFGTVALVEELLFRGVLQRALTQRLGMLPGVVVTSMIFGLMHSGYRLPSELVFGGIFGFILGYIYHKTDSIVLVVTMHGTLNLFLFAVIPIQGSPLEVVLAMKDIVGF